MRKASEYVSVFREIQKSLWVQVAIWLWATIGTYDLLVSQIIPDEYASDLPKTWQVALLTGGLLPVWGWALILAVIIAIGSLEYALRKNPIDNKVNSNEKLVTRELDLHERAERNRRALNKTDPPGYASPPEAQNIQIASLSFRELGGKIIELSRDIHRFLNSLDFRSSNDQKNINFFVATFVPRMFWLYGEAKNRGLHDTHLDTIRKDLRGTILSTRHIRHVAELLERFGHDVSVRS